MMALSLAYVGAMSCRAAQAHGAGQGTHQRCVGICMQDLWLACLILNTPPGAPLLHTCQCSSRMSTGAGPEAGMSITSPGYSFFML